MPDETAVGAARYPAHLAQVSRSFAACIAVLPPPLVDWVGLGYLLCRLLDTVEDAPWPQGAMQRAHFDQALTFAVTKPSPATVAAWTAGFPDELPSGEAALLADAAGLLADLHALPPKPRAALQKTWQRMGRGMRDFAERRQARGEVRLHDLCEVNRYCYVVAGVVGQLLSQLYACLRPEAAARLSPVDAVHFGLFLQKVNLLKDRQEDEQAGRFWLPDVALVADSLNANAEGAARYLLAIDKADAGFRLFCAYSLLLGAHSLGLYAAQPGAKLGRAQTQALFAQLGDHVGDDAVLKSLLDAALAELRTATARFREQAMPANAAPFASAAMTPSAPVPWSSWTETLGGDDGLRLEQAQALGMA